MELDLNRTGVINSEKVSDLRREMIPDNLSIASGPSSFVHYVR